jgi:uncharacterized membrane protein
MRNVSGNCGWDVQWLFLGVGAVLALIGAFLTASIVGAIIGIPLLLIAWALVKEPVVPATCT